MAKRFRVCPKCMEIIKRNDEVCSSCGLEVSKMQEYVDKQDELNDRVYEERIEASKSSEENAVAENMGNGIVVDTAKIMSEESGNVEQDKPSGENAPKPKRHKHKQKTIRQEDLPEYTVDENGDYDIDTKDVTFLEGIDHQTYSVKKARGDEPAREKIKWWEIYKWADLMLARRKINKEVKKASYKIPYGISKTAMLLYCIFFGWMGAHNFYAKNNARGIVMLSFDVIVAVVLNVPVLTEIMGVFVGGGLGFVIMFMWLKDLIDIIINHYKYRISKEEFISNLNVETRGKLPRRYWALDKTIFKAREEERINKIYNKKNKKKIKQERRLKKAEEKLKKQQEKTSENSENK